MSRITFKRVAPEQSNIYDDGDYVGEVYSQPEILNPGARYFVIHLIEDPRGWVRVHDRSRIREVAQRRLDTHPYF